MAANLARSQIQLELHDRARSLVRRTPSGAPSRQSARRLVFNQRHALRARPSARLRSLASVRLRRLELRRRAALFQARRRQLARRDRLPRRIRTARRHADRRDQPQFPIDPRYRKSGRHSFHRRLRGRRTGRLRHRRSYDQERFAFQRLESLSEASGKTLESAGRNECVDAPGCGRKRARERGRLFAGRRRASRERAA